MHNFFVRIALTVLLMLSPLSGAQAQYNINRLLMIGRSALYYEDYVLSIQYFTQAINAKPFLYEPWFLRGVAKYYLEDFVGAEADCNEGLRINPFVTNLYELRGLTRIYQNNYEGAIEDYTKALKYSPENQGYWHNRTLCRIQMKDYDGALADVDTMLMKWKKYARAYSMRAEIYLNKADTTAAIEALNKSVEMDPYDAIAWQALSVISLCQEEWEDAESYLDKAIHLQPKVAAYYINRALARVNQSNLRGAMADYDKALDIDPNNFLGHYNRGLLRAQVGDDNRAITDFDFVLNLEPDNVMALFNRALLLDKTGDLHGAIRDYTTVIDEFPNFWYGLEQRAACYRKLGMNKQAEDDEFRVYKARLYKSLYGVQPRLDPDKVRKRKEIDPSKYNQLVVADENEMEHEYENAYRGRVQNRQTDLALMPMYEMSFVKVRSEVESYLPYDKDVEAFNHDSPPKSDVVYIVCHQAPLDEKASNKYLAMVDNISDRLISMDAGKEKTNMLFRRAVANTMTQNFGDAIDDLTAFIEIDNTSALAYWQRAAAQMKENEFKASMGGGSVVSKGTPVGNLTLLQTVNVVADLDKAIALSPQNAYLYYNRGNVYAGRGDWYLAIADYDRAIAIDPALTEAYYNRGIAEIKIEKIQEAVVDLGKAGEGGLYKAYSVLKRYGKKPKEDKDGEDDDKEEYND